VLAFYLVVTLSNLGSLLEGRRWVYSVEFARLATLLATCGVLLGLGRFPAVLVAAVAGFGLISLAWFSRLRPVMMELPRSN
jgi:hypothetical protein